jgi:predicted MFS family arabinose efflux permease
LPFAQGLYGGMALAGGGLALAIVPFVEGSIGWQAPFATAAAVAVGGLALLVAGPADGPRQRHPREAHLPSGVLRDAHLYRLGAVARHRAERCSATAVTPAAGGRSGRQRCGHDRRPDARLGIVSRPLGGWILHAHPSRMRAAAAASLVAGALGTLAVAAVRPPALVVLGAILIGLAAGIPFAPAFTGAARLRPDAQAAAVGVVNGAACLVILVGTPLLGLAFSLPGGGRLGFAVVAGLWSSRVLP